MNPSSECLEDSYPHEDHLETGSPTNYDDDGDVSNVAVGTASPTFETQSPVEVPDISLGTSRGPGVVNSRNGNGSGRAPAPTFATAFPTSYEEDGVGVGSAAPATTSAANPSTSLLPVGSATTQAPREVAGGADSVNSNVAVASSVYAPTEPLVAPTQGQPFTLALNKQNLATFENSVQRGTVPLRTDVIDDRKFFEAVTTANGAAAGGAANNVEASLSVLTNYPTQSQRDGSIAAHNDSDLQLPQVTGGLQMSPLRRDDSSHLTAAERFSVVSVDSTIGSPFRPPADPLSQENLQLHLRELTSGAPVPLTTENITSSLPISLIKQGARDGRQGVSGNGNAAPSSGDDGAGEHSNANSNAGGAGAGGVGGIARREGSLAVEPSEAAPSEVASTADNSVLRTTLRTAAVSEAAMEELWSTASTRDADAKSQASWAPSTDALQSLSKASLRQLRRQLESGETPLRPEVLAGLSTVAKAMNIRSEPSPSMVVEVPGDEAMVATISHDDVTGLRSLGRGDGGSSRNARRHRLRGDQDDDLDEEEDVGDVDEQGSGSMQFKSPANAAVEDPAASDAAGMSFHSTLVEVPERGRTIADGDPRKATGALRGHRSGSTVDAVTGIDSVSNDGAHSRATRKGARGAVGGGGGTAPRTGSASGSVPASNTPSGGVWRCRSDTHSESGDKDGRGAVGSASGRGGTGSGGVGVSAAGGSNRHHHLNVSADLSADNGDLFGDVDVDAVMGDEDDDRNTHDDVDEVGDKSTRALSPDEDDDVDAHNEESVFMTEDGTEPRDDIAYLKRCLTEVIRTLKETRSDQVQLSRQLQSIKDDLSPAHASGRGVDFSDRNSERSYENRSPVPTSTPEVVNKHITSLRADMDEVRLYMREMQRAQVELIHKIERLQGVSREADSPSEKSAPQAPSQPPPQPLLATTPRKLRVVVECQRSLLRSAAGSPSQAPPPSGAASQNDVVRFLMPMPPESTVRQCREEFLRRLAEQAPSAVAGLNAENSYVEMGGHALFDSLVIGTDLQFEGTEAEGYCFTIRRSQ